MLSTITVNDVTRHVYLYGSLPRPEDLEEEIATWDSEWNYPTENVVVHINSHGGGISTMYSIMSRLEKVENLYTIVEGDCSSAALFIFLLGKLRAANKHTVFMAHNFIVNHGLSTETINNVKEFSEKTAETARTILNEYLAKPKYLTKKEVNSLIDGKELYIDYESAKERGIVNCDIEIFPSL